MKTMRYRIRVVTFILVASLFAMLLWCIRTVWSPAETARDPVLFSASPSASFLPDATPFPVSSTPGEPAATVDPYYDTYGL